MTNCPPIRRCRALLGSLLVNLVVAACLSCGGAGLDGGTDEASTSHAPSVPAPVEQDTDRTRRILESTRLLEARGLHASIDTDQQTVNGRFDRLRFEARLTGDGQAVATFERVAGMTLISSIDGPKAGTLEWRGTALDGLGVADTGERAAMAHYADRLKADELAGIPLDLACQDGAEALDPAIGAALLLPWQVLLKYQPEGEIPTPPEAAAESQCQYPLSPLEPIDLDRIAAPSVVGLSTEQPVPMAIGYFPFDREGIAEFPVNQGSPPP